MLRFLHTSDLHLGKRFGQMPEDLRGRLTEARHGALARLAAAARAAEAEAVLVAGDIFDTGTPAPATLRQALAQMAADPALSWVLLPGNHDSLAADELWAEAARRCPPNVTLALSPEPLAILPGAVILPAPATTRRPGRDLTAWMDAAPTPAGALRIGLAHGAVQSFGEDGAADVIAPDRATRAGLDYLALGDWHGQVRIDARTWYSGTPEPDRFKHQAPGRALLVALAGPGAAPQVTPVETGAFAWETRRLDLLPGEDAAARLGAALPAPAARRQTLLRLELQGRARLAGRTALAAAIAEAAPDFPLFEVRDSALAIEPEAADLDAIDRAGALRHAAETLL
ncbi:MAG: metallophosphoesterase, partial [Thermohalobaculum sp.]|nr:metallophosphoesterase [Thermohalobaculum sp.]